MEKQSEKELGNLVNSQKKQLQRYETRLKDVVSAYKGLLKEKEALEASLATVTKPSKKENDSNDSQSASTSNAPQNEETNDEDPENPQVQIATLMNSLATLSAEKSRMEASFQADKKQLRQEVASKDAMIREMKDKFKQISAKSSNEVENLKSKLIVERHERDQERNDHKMMVRELQKLLSDERHLKENLETQLNDLKIQFSQTNLADKTIRELSQELDSYRKKLKQMEANSRQDHSSQILQQLQNEMVNLKQAHAVAIKNEQILGEERSKELAMQHEERVANLESRLAELSNTVGTYDRLRQQDQEAIIKLKEKLIQLSLNQNQKNEQRAMNLNMIIDDILRLKKLLIAENQRQENPIDISKIFALNMIANDQPSEPSSKPSVLPLEDYRKLEIEYEKCLKANDSMKKSLEIQGNHIKTLLDKIKVLNRDIDHGEVEYKNKIIEHNSILRNEKVKYREIISSMEMDFRSKISQLEQQLQKQRDRSLLLLDEKENEIKTLKTSFEIFIPGNLGHHSSSVISHDAAEEEPSEGEMHKKKLSHLNAVLNPNSKSAGTGNTESYHMLHYAHELARKDVEISGLRKAKHETETALRQALQDKVMAQEELHEKIEALEEQVDRLERCKSREGANLEYLKNVILSFLGSSDNDSKKHMLNAIGAVLKFNPTEMTSINSYLNHKK